MSYLCVDAMEPSWRAFDAFQASRVAAFEVDSLASARPIEAPVESPDDASGMFDVLTYTKGAAVLRMIEQWLGPEPFRDGIRSYLVTHAYANTETLDLWDALETSSGRPVRRIMNAWIDQPGYPAISVQHDGDTIRLTQRRFAPLLPDDSTTWAVPLIVRQVLPDRELVEHVLVEAEGLDSAHRDAWSSRTRVRPFVDLLRRRAARRLVDGAMTTPGDRLGLATTQGRGRAGRRWYDRPPWRSGSAARRPPVWRRFAGLTWCIDSGDGARRFRAAVRDPRGRPSSGWFTGVSKTVIWMRLRGDYPGPRYLATIPHPDRARTPKRLAAGGVVEPAVAAAAIDTLLIGGPADTKRSDPNDEAPTPRSVALPLCPAVPGSPPSARWSSRRPRDPPADAPPFSRGRRATRTGIAAVRATTGELLARLRPA
jgi:hypothetical protein